MATMSTGQLHLVLGLALILKCQGMPLFMASSQYDINTGNISYTSNNTGTISYTSNNTCPPCKKGEKLLTNATATPHPCLCSKCSGQYTDIDDSCVQCDCCNKTNKITGENMWGHIMKECEALFQYHKCDRDVDFRVEECPAEPPYFPPPPTPTHPGPQPTTPPPPTVEFPWKYTVTIGVAAVLIVPVGIMGTIFLYKRRKRSNEERLLHKAVKETGGEEGGYSNERLQDAAGGFSERLQDAAGGFSERLQDAAGGFSERTQDAAGGFSERTQDAAGGFSERTQDAAGGFSERTQDVAGGFSERTQDAAGGFSERTQDAAGGFSERLQDAAGGFSERLQDAAGGFSERTQDVAGDSNERQTDFSPSVNSEDNETATLSGALTCESEQAANSLPGGPPARDSSIKNSMTDVSSKPKQDEGDDQVGVHENNVLEDAEMPEKAIPWPTEGELQNEDQQQDSNRSESLPQQNSGEVSFISVNPSTSTESDDDFVRIARRHNEPDRRSEERAEDDENGETFYKGTEGAVIRQATGDESSDSFFTIVKTGQQETGAVSPSAATHLDNPPAGDPNTVPIDVASNIRIWQEGGAETHAEVSAITAIDQQGLIQSQINEGDVRNDNYDETSCKAPVGDEAVQETGNESITKHGQQETGSVVKGGQQETASNPAQQSVESSPSQVVQEVDQYLLTRATEEETAEEFPGRETVEEFPGRETVEEFPETKPGLTPNPQPRVTTNSRSETTNQMSGQASGGTVRMQSLAGEEATQQTVTRDVSITKHGQQEAATVVKGGQQVTIVDNAQQSAESSPIQIVEAEEPVDSILSETDSATEQDLPDSGTGVDCGMAAAPRPADSKADEEELEPQNKETNLQASSQDEEGENDELNMVTPSSTGDQAQQDMGKEIVQNLPTTATAKEPVEGFPGAKRGLTIKPQPCITTDSRSETTNQMSGQASGGTVRVHHSDALSRPQVKANEHGSNYGDQVSDQDVANDQRPGEEEEAGDEDENAARCLEQVQDNDSVSTDG